ncbi:hypothetical protein DUI87_23074 [Hirundo rustica rustica]|uniref:Uncharacterized protein n=1 Tax=Hirundo rustica rustica TaxID=333673 RepID=A0A3M0JN43_HIRRU|nr:hypothetical protein DUI87_23074 [Hirundo rustica rustica]
MWHHLQGPEEHLGSYRPVILTLVLGKLMEQTILSAITGHAQDKQGTRPTQRGPELQVHDCENDQFPADPEIAWDLLLQLDPCKSMGRDGTHLRSYLMSSQSLSQRFSGNPEVPPDMKLANIILIFKKAKKDLRNYRPVSLNSVPGKIMEKIILGSTEKHLEDNTAIDHNQHGSIRVKSCLLNLISFYNRVTHLKDLRKPADVIFLDFCKAFCVLLGKLSRPQLDKHIMCWVSNWLTGQAQSWSEWSDIRVGTCH